MSPMEFERQAGNPNRVQATPGQIWTNLLQLCSQLKNTAGRRTN